MLLGVDAGVGIVGASAVGAIRLLRANFIPKRVRVVTDIDDTVKSSGNKRLLGVPLGGIDAQCETFSTSPQTRTYRACTFVPGMYEGCGRLANL